MPMPQEVQLCAQRHDALLTDLADALSLATRNQAHTALDATLMVIRRRCSANQLVALAPAFPVVARAMLVQPSEGPPSADADAEARGLRAAHNFLPPGGLAVAAKVVRRHCDIDLLDRLLPDMQPEAAELLG